MQKKNENKGIRAKTDAPEHFRGKWESLTQTRLCSRPCNKISLGRSIPMKTILLVRNSPAAQVDEVAKEFVAKQGADKLPLVAKVHFRTALRAQGLPEPPKQEWRRPSRT